MAWYRLDVSRYPYAREIYTREKYRYPLIAAVLDDTQDGDVFVNRDREPTVFFVVHSFGYSQVYGEVDDEFCHDLRKYLFVDQNFAQDKIRVYSPYHKQLFIDKAELSERCQFRIFGDSELVIAPTSNIAIVNVSSENSEEINRVFGLDLFHRFWRNKEDFLLYGTGKVVSVRGEYASICYAAALADGIAEIDVATLPHYRQQHLGKYACAAFIRACRDTSVTPNWDCFTNNTRSLRLAQSLGYEPINESYCFFTITRDGAKPANRV